MKINIAIFASGSGTNAEKLVRHFRGSPVAAVRLIICNKPKAFVLERAAKLGVESKIINKKDLAHPERLVRELKRRDIDLIVLAGFLWLVPEEIVNAFPQRILNIHPALLPKYGGKGMYGNKVHSTVKKNRETETGITIHFVDNKYDTGNIILQKKVSINPYLFSEDQIASKVHELEYEWYAKMVEQVAEKIKNDKTKKPTAH